MEPIRDHPPHAVLRARFQDKGLGALLPAVAESLTPPDREGVDWDALGASAQAIREFALGGLTRRLKIIGVELS